MSEDTLELAFVDIWTPILASCIYGILHSNNIVSHITHRLPRVFLYKLNLLISTLCHSTVWDRHYLLPPREHLQHNRLYQ